MRTPDRDASPVHAHLLQTAADWFVDFRVGDADAQARKEFFAWLRQSPEHIRAYMQISESYADSLALKNRLQIDMDAIVARAREESNVVALQAPRARVAEPLARIVEPPEPSRRRPSPWLAAAATALISSVGVAWYMSQRAQTYDSPVGEQHLVVLADGSKVTLDARSRLRVRLTQRDRDLHLLAGQALFEVAADPLRPFTVRSRSVTVRAVGTRFDVIERADGATVTVIQGSVEVRPESGAGAHTPFMLSAGEQVVVSSSAGLTPPVQTDVAAAISWTAQRLVFESAPLARVIEDFNRHNTRQLVLRNSQLGELRITGTFAANQPESFVRFLRSQPGVIVQDRGAEVDIDRR
jgi:transmembrane sensor